LEQVAGIHVVIETDDESIDDTSSDASSYHLSDHYYCPSDDDEYPTSSDDDESSNSDMPVLQPREADCSTSSSDDEGTTASNGDLDQEGDDVSIQGSILNDPTDGPQPVGFQQDAFGYDVHIPPPLSIPPVSCIAIPNDKKDIQYGIVIPNNGDDVNSLTTAPVSERVNPSGRVPVRIQQDCFEHVDDVICYKPTLIDIGGEPIHN
jgi:hypothetical protein